MEGNTRRLPAWMIGGASSVVPAKASRSDNDAEVTKTKVGKRPKRAVKPQERDDAKKVGIKRKGREGVRSKMEAPSIGDVKDPEIIESVIRLRDEDFTVDDLLSFAREYVKCEEDQTIKDSESLSTSESMVVEDNSNVRSSRGETKEPNAVDMLSLLLGPFFTKP